MNRSEKEAMVNDLRDVFQNAQSVVVVSYKGLKVSDMSEIRNNMRNVNAKFRVFKNTLSAIASEGTAYEGMKDLFSGAVALAWSDEDPVSPAKVAYDFSKQNDALKIMGGALSSNILDKQGVESLAKLPSLDQLRAKIAAVVLAPATKVATIAAQPAVQVVNVLDAYSKK